MLIITYTLSGSLDLIKIPVPADKPSRKNRLWEQTCFELFVKAKGSDSYREFNLSPSGNWNAYRFNSYRKEMTEETAFSELPFCLFRQPDTLKLEIKIRLKKIIPPDIPVHIAISAVIESNNNKISFWALTHPGPKPDFHHPGSFRLELSS